MFKRLLIANRGEIACRIIRSAQKLGIRCIAIYSEVDAEALHVKQADEAYCIGSAASRDSYLNMDNIIRLAIDKQIDAIHPGYGFLAENAKFAALCAANAITFIGPSAKAIELMGNKNGAKGLLANAGIAMLPSYYGKAQDEASLERAAEQIGYPVLLKPAAGGGGKGMRIVDSPADFTKQLSAAKREALASFANDEILIEKYLPSPRHIEVQIFADKFGQVVHLFDRDCSLQRRYQKVIEEAPAPNISPSIRQELYSQAIKVAQTIAYQGAGTVEFLLDGDAKFYFMEMNTRLQVEHPVTEMITGYDLVTWQLQVAAGEKLPCSQSEIRLQGHAMEGRICAENPAEDFLPSAGKIHCLQFPATTPWLRVDTGFTSGDSVSPYYDSLLAKLIVHGADREQALFRFGQALAKCKIAGVHTNLPLLARIASLDDFQQAKLHTQLIAAHQARLLQTPEIPVDTWLAAGLFIVLSQRPNSVGSPWQAHDGWRLNTRPYQQTLNLQIQETTQLLQITYLDQDYLITLADKIYRVKGYLEAPDKLCLNVENRRKTMTVFKQAEHYHVLDEAETWVFKLVNAQYQSTELVEHSLCAQLPGTLVAILAKPGDKVSKGMPLVAIEAMKMEHLIRAPHAGIVANLYYAVGDQIAEGAELLSLRDIDYEITEKG